MAAAVKTVFVINLPPYVYDRCYVRNVFGDVDQISTQHCTDRLLVIGNNSFVPRYPVSFMNIYVNNAAMCLTFFNT
jgi:hypothetical protein